jgi:hypothetical protein
MIFLSVAHRPDAKGASFGDFNEYEESILWTQRLMDYLDGHAVEVPHGRLEDKVAFINQGCHDVAGYHIAVEVHFNAATNSHGEPIGRGCEALYCPGSIDGEALADKICHRLQIPFPPNRGPAEGWFRRNPSRGIIDYFLEKTACTAVIIEPEFVHHADKIREARDVGCMLIAEQLMTFMEARE